MKIRTVKKEYRKVVQGRDYRYLIASKGAFWVMMKYQGAFMPLPKRKREIDLSNLTEITI